MFVQVTKNEPLVTISGTKEIYIGRWDFIQHPRASVTFLQVCAPIGILSVPGDSTLEVSVSNINHRNTGKYFRDGLNVLPDSFCERTKVCRKYVTRDVGLPIENM